MKSSGLRSSPMTPTAEELEAGCTAFRLHETRDAMYRTASFLVEHFWGQPAELADSLGVLLLTWNQAHYRYGSFDFSKLQRCLETNAAVLQHFRARNILDFTPADEPDIRYLFDALLSALCIADGSRAGAQSPVAVGKALHLLAPDFFPMWDKKIAQAYSCGYSSRPTEKYLAFMRLSKNMACTLRPVIPAGSKNLLKLLDEYNYAKYTKAWI
ncbi:MAG: hypothetical protein JO139_15665 [Alphaproteobacteria bacterium]|nr:hypothetical protein [Alphaproteobacteria bacterium]